MLRQHNNGKEENLSMKKLLVRPERSYILSLLPKLSDQSCQPMKLVRAHVSCPKIALFGVNLLLDQSS